MRIFTNYSEMHRVQKKSFYSGADFEDMLFDVSILEDVQKESLLGYINAHYSDEKTISDLSSVVNEANKGIEHLYNFEMSVREQFAHLYEATIPHNSWRRYCYAVANWSEYDLVDTKEQFIALMNILKAHGENLDSLHSCEDEFCGIIFSNPGSDRDIVEGLFEYNSFFPSKAQFVSCMKDNAEFDDMTVDEEMDSCDLHYEMTGIVNILHY